MKISTAEYIKKRIEKALDASLPQEERAKHGATTLAFMHGYVEGILQDVETQPSVGSEPVPIKLTDEDETEDDGVRMGQGFNVGPTPAEEREMEHPKKNAKVKKSGGGASKKNRCGKCGGSGHNKKTCPGGGEAEEKETEESEDDIEITEDIENTVHQMLLDGKGSQDIADELDVTLTRANKIIASVKGIKL